MARKKARGRRPEDNKARTKRRWPDGPFLENEQMTSIDWTPWSPQGHRQAATAEALLPVGIPKAEWSSGRVVELWIITMIFDGWKKRK